MEDKEDKKTVIKKISYKRYLFMIVFVLCCFTVFSFGAEGEDQGFWAEMLWGTELNPGVFREVITWFNDVAYTIFADLLSVALGLVPFQDFTPEQVTSLKGYMQVANCWVPLFESLTMLFGYWLFVASFSALKMILKLIPTIG